MKKLLLLTFFILTYISVSAQPAATIKGIVADETTSEAIAGAVIELTPLAHPDNKKYSTSESRGRLNVPGILYGDYSIKVSFLGYEDLVREVKVESPTVDLGHLEMRLASRQIDMVSIEAQAMRTSQKGDTIIYNADAFKVSADADAETLLSKMPGITVLDGEVEAQGESIKKIYVDGKEFFGDDVTTAIKNIPAEVITHVEVYNKLSDQAEFTGIDDGDGFKALNFITTIDKGQFGKFYGAYGIEDKYNVGGNYNYFKGDSRVSILGMANNLNQVNFAMEDILGAVGGSSAGMQSRGGGHMRMRQAGGFMMRPQDGISKVGSFGVNYNDKWGKKFDISASYFFNTTRNDNERISDRKNFSTTDTYTANREQTTSWSRNYENRFHARMEYKINDNHSLMMRPRLSWQNYDSWSGGQTENFSVTGETETMLNTVGKKSESDNSGYNLGNSIIYRVKLGKPGRTMTVDVGGQISDNDRHSVNISQFDYLLIRPDSTGRQRSLNDVRNWNLNGSIIYTEPVSNKAQITMQYRAEYRYSDSDRRTYLWDEIAAMYDPDFDTDLSSVYNSGYLTQRVGPGFNYSNNRDVINGNISYQSSSLDGDGKIPMDYSTRRRFDNVVYHLMVNKSFNSTNTLRIHARSYTNNPSITQLQDVTDRSDAQYITAGNPNLKPTYAHNIFANYNRSSVTKGTTFMLMGGFNIQTDYIAESKEIFADGSQFTRPENMNGRWSANGMVSFGLPLNFIKSNINLNLGYMYNETPSYINETKNKQKSHFYNGGTVLGSNISELVDFTLTWNGGYNLVNNSVGSENDNDYFSHSATFRIKWEIWKGITFTANGTFTQYKGITDKYNEHYTICNAYIGKKMLKRRGEISIGVNDIFDQNTSFSRRVMDTYIENVRSSAIGRYVGIQFVYNLRSFGKGSGATERDPLRGLPGPGSGRPPGPHPGGGRGGFAM